MTVATGNLGREGPEDIERVVDRERRARAEVQEMNTLDLVVVHAILGG